MHKTSRPDQMNGRRTYGKTERDPLGQKRSPRDTYLQRVRFTAMSQQRNHSRAKWKKPTRNWRGRPIIWPVQSGTKPCCRVRDIQRGGRFSPRATPPKESRACYHGNWEMGGTWKWGQRETTTKQEVVGMRGVKDVGQNPPMKE